MVAAPCGYPRAGDSVASYVLHCLSSMAVAFSTSSRRSLLSALLSSSTSASVRSVPSISCSTKPFVAFTCSIGSSIYCHTSLRPGLTPSFHAPRTSWPFDILKYVLLCLGSPCSRSEEHTSELQSRENLVCRLLLEIINT